MAVDACCVRIAYHCLVISKALPESVTRLVITL